MRRLFVLALMVATAACGSSDVAPTPAPTYAQAAGVYRGTAKTIATSGGECLAAAFQSAVNGTFGITVAVTQSGSSVSATLTEDSNGGNFTYSGAVGLTAISMTGNSCSACNVVGASCPSSTAKRDFRIQTSSVTGSVSGGALSGTETETYNIFVSGTSTSVGVLTLTTTFSLTKQ